MNDSTLNDVERLPASAGSAGWVGKRVEWTDDMRPMPGQWPGDDEADSPCWDMSLVQRRTGTIVAISRTIFGAWKCLIETDGGFHCGPIELDVRELRPLRQNGKDDQR